MVLIFKQAMAIINSALNRFRPLAGIMVLIVIAIMLKIIITTWFPSPCGDYGSYPKSVKKSNVSPLVSVPLRGLWFLSLTCWMQPPDPMMMFPSPCGDYGSYRNQQEQQHWSARRFPSPCGDYGSYRGTKINAFIVEVSVPLRGLWFLSNTDFSSNRKVRVVSVPLRGLWFLSVGKHDLLRRLSICFRPLAGIMVLIVIH